MTRFANAPWPLKVAVATAGATLVVGLVTGIALVIALAGLKKLSADVDPAAVPAWFWYYRYDPEVRRWLGIGLISSFGLSTVTVVGALRNRRPPLHGAARWASEAELARGGIRARQGVVIGRKGGRLLTFGGPEHVMLYAPDPHRQGRRGGHP